MEIKQVVYSGERDLRCMAMLACAFHADCLHVVDLPYRFSSWAFDNPENVGLWVDAEDWLVGWAVMQGPFWAIDFAYHPGAPEILETILGWADRRVRALLGTPGGLPAWFANVFSDRPDRIRALEEAGFASQADKGEDSWSKVFMERPAELPLKEYSLPAGFTLRPLGGEAEVGAYVDLHRSVFETRNMTVESLRMCWCTRRSIEMDRMGNRKNWTRQQDQLRKLLAATAHFEEAIRLFMQQHASVHTAEVYGGQAWSLQDEVLAGLTDGQIKTCLRPGINSIAWLLWHTTRIEDLSINFLVMGEPQVLDRESWGTQLGLSLRDVGASMNDAEVASLSAQISIPALKGYRAAVGRSTRAAVACLQPAQLKEIVSTPSIQKLVDEGSISAKGIWLAEYYTGRTKGFFLTRTATSHNFIHLNEAGRVRARLLQPARKR